jgi:phosphoglycolate phosphatase
MSATPGLEVVNPAAPRGRFRAALFDFDGTLSLLRGGWPQVMVPMMVAVLRQTGTAESDAELTSLVEDFVFRLNGRKTIHQMERLAEEVARRGGTPRDPETYKQEYSDRLMDVVGTRYAGITGGTVPADDWTVPGCRGLLGALAERGLTLALASGTDLVFVRHELDLLGLTHFFGGRIDGAREDRPDYAKRQVIERLVAELNLGPGELVGFGDGVVETEEVKRAGGVAVAVATDELVRGRYDAAKRDRLVAVGADAVVPHYGGHAGLVGWLFGEGA